MKTGQQASKRAGKTLKPADVDDAKKIGNHLRSESRKNHFNRIVICAYYGGLVAIPLLYIGFLLVNRHNTSQLSTGLWSGLTATVGFLFGHVSNNDSTE